MAQLLEIVSDGTVERGWTARLGPFTARVDGDPIALPDDCTAQIRGKNQATYVDMTGDVVLADQGTNPGQFYLDPDASDFTYQYSPYSLRLKAVDDDDKTAYFGSAVEPDLIKVGRP